MHWRCGAQPEPASYRLWRVRVRHHYSPGCRSLKKNDNWPVLKVFSRDTDLWRERNHFTRQRGYRSFTSKMFWIKIVQNLISNKRLTGRMSTSPGSGSRGLIIFGIVISSEVLFENELIIHNFTVSFMPVFQLLLQFIFTDPMKYMVQFLGVLTFLDHSYSNGGYRMGIIFGACDENLKGFKGRFKDYWPE